jgi:hypothetical protein
MWHATVISRFVNGGSPMFSFRPTADGVSLQKDQAFVML